MPAPLQTSRLARQFRPMTLGEILDRAFELYRNNFPLLGGLGVLTLFPLYSFVLGWLYFIYYNRELWGSPEYLVLAAPLIVGIVVSASFSFLARSAAIYALARRAAGEEVQLLESFVHALRRTVTLILMGVSGFFLSVLFGVFYLFPILFVSLLFGLTFPVATLEDRPYFYAFSRSYQLLKGSTGKMIGLFFTFRLLELLGWLNLILLRFLVVSLSHSLLDIDLSLLNRFPYGLLILLFLTLIFLHPLKVCAYTLVYFDSRIRNEGWDLWLRIEEITHKPLKEHP